MTDEEFSKRPTRISARVEAVLTTSDGHSFPVTIRDVSARGFRLELRDQVIVGEHVGLVIGSSEMRAEIKWALGDEAGGVFLDTGDQEVPS